MGAYLRTVVALSLMVVLLASPSSAQSTVPGARGGGRPGVGSGRRDGSGGSGRVGDQSGRRGRRPPFPQFGSPFYGMMGMMPYAYAPAQEGSSGTSGYTVPELPPGPVPEIPRSLSSYARINGVLYQFDLNGDLIAATPVPSKPWPRGGQDALEALRLTGGYWAARLTGLQAAHYTLARGSATFWLDEDNRQLHFRLDLRGIRNITSAYIYLGDPNLPTAAAPPVAPLYVCHRFPGRFCGTLAEGSLVSSDLFGWLSGHPIASLVQAMDNGQAIVRVNTARHPQGELEGVVAPVLLEPTGG